MQAGLLHALTDLSHKLTPSTPSCPQTIKPHYTVPYLPTYLLPTPPRVQQASEIASVPKPALQQEV